MKKTVVILTAAVLAFGAVNAFATASRMETLGNQGLYLVDDTNVFSNPAVMSYYRGCLFIHYGGFMGGDTSAIGAITVPLGDVITLGLLAGGPGALVAITEGNIGTIRYDAIMGGAFVDHFNGAYFGGVTPPNNSMETAWMNPFGVILSGQFGDVSVGMEYRLVNGKRNEKDDIAETEYDQVAQLHDLHFGVSAKTGNMMPEVWFHYAPYWMRSEFTDDDADFESTEKLRGNKFVLGGRLLYSMSDSFTIVPAATWEHVTGSVTIDTDDDTDMVFQGEDIDEEDLGQDYTVDSILIGLNGQYNTGGFFGLLVTGSVGLKWSKWERELSVDTTDFSNVETSKSFAVPTAQLGIEYWHNQTVCFRGGIDTTMIWASSTEIDEEDDVNGDGVTDASLMQTVQQTTAAIGVGLHFGPVLVDATFGNFFLTNEDGNSGLNGGPNLFSNLDIKAKWK